jgi:hypothetical protein
MPFDLRGYAFTVPKARNSLAMFLAAFVILGATNTQSASANSIDYQACMDDYGYTPSAVAVCLELRPSAKQAKPIEYKHCLRMYTNVWVGSSACKQYRPEIKVAKPIEYAYCLKTWGRTNPDCQKYRP